VDGAALKTWLVQRLTSEEAEKEWAGLLESGFEAMLDAPFERIVPREASMRAVRQLVATPRLVDLVRPGARLVLPLILAWTREDDLPVGRWVPRPAQDRIAKLAARPGWIQDDWIDALYQTRAAEELLADTLYTSLRDFSTIVPRIVQSVMPSPLGKLAKLGGRATGGVTGRVIDEVDRRLEVEIKKFLEKGTRRALDGAAKFTREHIDDPSAADAREQLARFAMERSAIFHTRPLTPAVVKELDEIAEAIAVHVAASEEVEKILEVTTERVFERFEGDSLRAALEQSGIAERPPYAEWAAASWPAATFVLGAPGIDTWLTALCEQIVDQLSGG
jgi:hypothetical protein